MALGTLAVCLAGTGALAACGSSSASGSERNGKVSITFMEAMSSGTLKTSLEHLTQQFEQANPNIKVNLDAVSDYGTLQTKETAAIAAGKPPTIGQAYEDWAATFANSKAIVPISNFATADDLSHLYDGVKKDLYLPGNQLYMWPFNKSVVITYYNQAMLQAKHLTAPTTWDQFATDAKAVAGNGTVGIAIDPGTSSGAGGGESLFEMIAGSYGTPVFGTDGSPQFNSPAAVQAMQYLVNLKNAGALAVGTNYPGETDLGAGKGLFDVSSVASYYYDQQAIGGKFPMGTAAAPAGPAGRTNALAGTNIVMFAKASSAEQKAAWTYMKFLSSASSQAYWAENSGYLPVTPDAMAQMTDFVAKNPYVKFAADDLSIAVGAPPYSWITKCQGDLAVAMQSALSGKQTAAAALADAQKQATADKSSSQ
ncbi:ABC transporter substrate-binding protein [Rugosimonospora acidiphila]|uniref:ABC transporter substrate-binding protein n=2 Tax=Rugosimonospora acidiphila TaxID=556531 RepID=A0ABP9S4F6_9ACTN